MKKASLKEASCNNSLLQKLVGLIWLTSFALPSNAQIFEQLGPGFLGSTDVRCLYYDEEEDLLYVGGNFNYSTENVALASIGVWDGVSLTPLGCGFDWSCNELDDPQYAIVSDILEFQDTIYSTGSFNFSGSNELNGVAKWTGEEWVSVGFLDGWCRLAIVNDTLFVHGQFVVEEENIDGLAWWNAVEGKWKSYHDLPNLWGSNNQNMIYDIELFQGELYLGGNFSDTDLGVTDLIKWTGSEWMPVDGLCGGLSAVVDMSVYQNELVVSGTFSLQNCPANPGNFIASYDGAEWSNLGQGMDSQVNQLQVIGDDLIATGSFTQAGQVSTSLVAKWDGQEWCGYGWNDEFPYFNEPFIYTIAKYQNKLIIGGGFQSVDGEPMAQLVKYIGPDSCLISHIENLDIEETNIYPNPVTDVITISVVQPSSISSITIFDSVGRQVLNGSTSEELISNESGKITLEFANYSSGVYFLEIISANQRRMFRMVKE